MSKDPALLFYTEKWLVSTAEMDSDVRGWYLNLILHQHNKGDLPKNIEKLAVLAGVKFSEYNRFEQVFEQVLEQKFEENDSGRLENPFAKEILKKRDDFKEKRSLSGKISYVIRYATKNYKLNKRKILFLKDNINFDEIDTKNEQVLKQVIEQKLELYININENINTNTLNTEEILKDKAMSIPPSLEDVQKYCSEKNSTIDPVEFFHFYQSKGWMIGSNKMKNWHSAIATWERKKKEVNRKPDKLTEFDYRRLISKGEICKDDYTYSDKFGGFYVSMEKYFPVEYKKMKARS